MQLTDLPDELLFEIIRNLALQFEDQRRPSEDTFSYNSNIRYIISSDKYKDFINLSLTCKELRSLVILFLQKENGSLQLSLARKTEVPNLIEFKKFKNSNNCPFDDQTISLNCLFASHVTSLEICLDFMHHEFAWESIVEMFHKKLTSLKILGTTEHYRRLFSSSLQSKQYKFTKLQKLSLPLPDYTLAFEKLGKSIDWRQLSQLNVFFDPYAGFSINVIEEIMNSLISKFNGDHNLQVLQLIGGNDVIYNNFTLLLKLSQFISKLTNLTSLAISHKKIRPPSFSSYSYTYETSYVYHDYSYPFVELFKSIRNLPHLGNLTFDTEALRLFHNEFAQVFSKVQFQNNIQKGLELVLCEPTFIYPMSSEQLKEMLSLILLIQPTSLSFRFGLQIELTMSNYAVLLVQQLLSILTTRFNYTKICSVSYELCWSIIEDSYILEHNDNHKDHRILRWQTPAMASSIYKTMEQQLIRYSTPYPDEDVDYVKLMNSELVKYPLCEYRLLKKGNDELKRLSFWELQCNLSDYVVFNNLGNRKGSIFD